MDPYNRNSGVCVCVRERKQKREGGRLATWVGSWRARTCNWGRCIAMTTIGQSGPCGKSSYCLSASQDENREQFHKKECLCDNKHTITLVSQMLCLGIRHLLLLSSVLFHPFSHSISLTHSLSECMSCFLLVPFFSEKVLQSFSFQE